MGEYSKLKTSEPIRAKCPVCRETVYSLGGIHPQCAQLRADKVQPRDQIRQAKPLLQMKWTKQCPKCKLALHVRRGLCDCGFDFKRELRS